MSLSDLTLTFAWLRASGRCECREPGHGHPGGRCGALLVWTQHGVAEGEGAWQACRKNGTGNGGHDHLHNTEVRCIVCVRQTSGGRNG